MTYKLHSWWSSTVYMIKQYKSKWVGEVISGVSQRRNRLFQGEGKVCAIRTNTQRKIGDGCETL